MAAGPALISDIVSHFLSSVPCLVIPYLLSGTNSDILHIEQIL